MHQMRRPQACEEPNMKRPHAHRRKLAMLLVVLVFTVCAFSIALLSLFDSAEFLHEPRFETFTSVSAIVGIGGFLFFAITWGATLPPPSNRRVKEVLLSGFAIPLPPVLWAVALCRFAANVLRLRKHTQVAISIIGVLIFWMLMIEMPVGLSYPWGARLFAFFLLEPMMIFVATRVYWLRGKGRTTQRCNIRT